MKSTPPILIVEPSGQGTRRRLSGALLGLSAQPSLQDLISQLREMRERCLSEQESLVAEFRDKVSHYPGTECLSARDGVEAAEFVRRIARDSRNVVLNRSASVANELKHRLLEIGFRVIEPYHSEPGNFENRIGDYWDLPALQTKGLTPSFEIQKVNTDLGLEAGDEEYSADTHR